MPPQPPHERLDALMTYRIAELGIGWEQLASRTGLKYETIRGIRKGESGGRPLTRRAISVALGWTPDSVDRILAGGDPAEATAAPAVHSAPAGDRAAVIAAGVSALYPDLAGLAEYIMGQEQKPLEMRERELRGALAAHGITTTEQRALQVSR